MNNFDIEYNKLNINYNTNNFITLNKNIDFLYNKLNKIYNDTENILKEFNKLSGFDTLFYNLFKILFYLNLGAKYLKTKDITIFFKFNISNETVEVKIKDVYDYINDLFNKIQNNIIKNNVISLNDIIGKFNENKLTGIQLFNIEKNKTINFYNFSQYEYECNTNPYIYINDNYNQYIQNFKYKEIKQVGGNKYNKIKEII